MSSVHICPACKRTVACGGTRLVQCAGCGKVEPEGANGMRAGWKEVCFMLNGEYTEHDFCSDACLVKVHAV